MRYTILILALLSLSACIMDVSPVATSKAKYHYVYTSDTLYHDDMTTWNGEDTTETDYKTGNAWTSVSVTLYQGANKFAIGSGTFKSPTKAVTKPVYWDGTTLVIHWDRLASNWDKVIIRYSLRDSTSV